MKLNLLDATNRLAALHYYERAIAGLAEPWPRAIAAQAEISAELRELQSNRFGRKRLIGVLQHSPGAERAAISAARQTALQRCLVALLAAQRHRLAHGRLPESLTEMNPRLFGPLARDAERLNDPFDGRPLRFLKDDPRSDIFTVGDNGQDDGGDFIDQNRQPLDYGYSLK